MAVSISIIIPCRNEESQIRSVVRLLMHAMSRYAGKAEIIVVDGNSTDQTLKIAQELPGVTTYCCQPSRALQMNYGVAKASGDVMYFVHADSRPPLDCLNQINTAVGGGSQIGGYAFEFDSQRSILRFNSWFTQFNVISFRGGDQTIFVTRALFEKLAGFGESWVIMEEYDFIKRATDLGNAYRILEGRTLVSARKYEGRSWVRVQIANICAMTLWRLGKPSTKIRSVYCKILGD